MNASDVAARTARLSEAKRRLLEQRLRGGSSATRLPDAIPRRAGDGPAALSFAQQRLWFLDRLTPGNAVHNIPAALRLTGPLDLPALERSFSTLARRQQALCTAFPTVDGEPRQRIDLGMPAPLTMVDLRHRAAVERESAARRLAAREARRPFDLAQGPLWRVLVARLDAQDHLLVVTMHHLISDGWSIAILTREMSELYAAEIEQRPHRLRELPLQYADYAEWQRRWLQGDVLNRQLSYWRRRLAGAPLVLELPGDRPRPAVQSHRGGYHSIGVPRSAADSLRLLGGREGTTLFMVLLAAFGVVLHRHTGEADILVGTPVANRSRIETEELIGCFVNTLVLRLDLRGNPTIRGLLARIREAALDAFAHQTVPFEHVVDALRPPRDPSRSPVFQVMLVLQNAQRSAPELHGLSIRQVAVATGLAKLELTLEVVEKPDGRLVANWEYAADLFDANTIKRMAQHFGVLIEALAADPERRVNQLPLLTRAERHRVVREWNATAAADGTAGGLIPARMAGVGARAPGEIAVRCEGSTITYGVLHARASQLARHLAQLGVGPEVRVGVSLERSADLVIALLAIWKAGGAYVPLEPGLPPARLAFMMSDSAVRLVITRSCLAERVTGAGARVVCIDTEAEAIAAQQRAEPAVTLLGDHAAYVIYTSGSTGQPKGVVNTHRAILNRLHWMQAAYALGPADRVLQKTPLGFDVSVWELFWPLMIGARLVVARPEGHRDRQYLAALVEREQVTVLHFVPSMLQSFVEQPGLERAGCSVRLVVCSGEALQAATAAQLASRWPHATLVNLYGPTEAAVDVTAATYERGATSGVVSIGRPIANVQAYVLDETLEPTPVGVAGELYVGGIAVARGYTARQALTAERFVPDPFSRAAGARLYRTGDRATWSPDGTLRFLGRADDQVKLRGCRIEPGEIEAVLLRQPRVRQAAVRVIDDVGGRRLVAYVAAAAENATISERLHRALTASLPDYMIPAAIVVLDELPLTPNGKVDRRSLPASGSTRPPLAPPVAPPRTSMEREISAAWREVLRLDRVGVLDNFFDLGGNSLSLARLHEQLRRIRDFPLVELFRHSTVRAIATYLGDDTSDTGVLLDDSDQREQLGRRPTRLARRAELARSAGLAMHPDDLTDRS